MSLNVRMRVKEYHLTRSLVNTSITDEHKCIADCKYSIFVPLIVKCDLNRLKENNKTTSGAVELPKLWGG